MFNVDFRFEKQQTTLGFPCDEEYLSVKFSELGVDDKLNTSQYNLIRCGYTNGKYMMSYYEVTVIYDKDYGEVITFESDAFMNDSNDIVTEAVRLMLLEEKYRSKVRLACCVSEYEYKYIVCKEK